MSREPTNLGRWVRTPGTSEARLARQWANVSSRLGARGPSRFGLFPRLAAAMVLVLVVVLGVTFRPRTANGPTAIDGAVLETEAGEQESLTLPDGSRIVLEALTRVRLARVSTADVRLELERGAVRLEVVHVDNRKFLVAANGYEVHVVGTKFRVAIGAGAIRDVTVAVDEGKVAVHREGVVAQPTYIGAGETFVANPDGPPAPSVAPDPAPLPSASTAPSSWKKPLGPKRKLPARFHELFRNGEYAGAYAEIAAEDYAQLVLDLGAQDLLELAITARLTGHPRRAAMALERIRTAFRKDNRVGVAALELGRIRLDELHDPEGALDALDDAVLLAPDATLREDAEARRVQAYERMGDLVKCAAARDVYLLKYPEGIHTTTVARRCKSP